MSMTKINEQRLALDPDRMASILETMNEWVWETDGSGRYVYCSSKIKSLLGYEPEDAIGKTAFDFMVPEERDRVGAEFRKIAAARQPFFGLVNRNLHRNGSVVVLETSGAPVLDQAGEIVGFVGTDRDITEQVNVQEELRAREGRLRLIIETMNEWVWEVDARGTYTYSSPKVRDMLGYEPGEVIGRTPFDFMPPDEVQRIGAEFAEIVAARQPFSGLVNRNVRKDGTEVLLETAGAPVFDDAGELKGFIGTDRDVTAQTRAQEELKVKLETIERQSIAIQALSTPVIEIWDGILVLPVVGVVDSQRSLEIMERLLESIADRQAKCVVIDITGVEVVDTKTADYLLRVARAATLMGARTLLTGLSPAVAQTLVGMGSDLSEVRTLRSLKEGLRECLRFLQHTGEVRPA